MSPLGTSETVKASDETRRAVDEGTSAGPPKLLVSEVRRCEVCRGAAAAGGSGGAASGPARGRVLALWRAGVLRRAPADGAAGASAACSGSAAVRQRAHECHSCGIWRRGRSKASPARAPGSWASPDGGPLRVTGRAMVRFIQILTRVKNIELRGHAERGRDNGCRWCLTAVDPRREANPTRLRAGSSLQC